jgi:hypothetical protein
MDFSKVLINCSRLRQVMTEPKDGLTEIMFDEMMRLQAKEVLTDKQKITLIELKFRFENFDPLKLSSGCESYLMFLYQYLKYGKQYQIRKGKLPSQMVKGNVVEKHSLDLVRRATGQKLYKQKRVLRNEHLRGQLDASDAATIESSNKVVEIKTKYSHADFMKCVTSDNETRATTFQAHGYFALTGMDYAEVYHCLTDFSDEMIAEERKKMVELLCPDGVETKLFREEWAMAENSMRFSHVPDEERVVMFRIEREDKLIDKIYEKVELCREWLASFEKKHNEKVAAMKEIWAEMNKNSYLKSRPVLG